MNLNDPISVVHTEIIPEGGRATPTLPPLSRMVNEDRYYSPDKTDTVVHSEFTQGDFVFSFFTARMAYPIQSLVHRICQCVSLDEFGNLDLQAEPCDEAHCSLNPWDEGKMGSLAPGAVQWHSPISANAWKFEADLGTLIQEWDPMYYAILSHEILWTFHRLVQTFGVRHRMGQDEWRAMLAKESRVLTR